MTSFFLHKPSLRILMVRGVDATVFLDGLSTNLIPVASGFVVRTAFTDRAAKIIASAYVLTRDEGAVLVVDSMWFEGLVAHLAARMLSQDVELVDLSQRNQVVFEFGPLYGPDLGTWNIKEGTTVARVHEELLLHIGSPAFAEEKDAEKEWDAWRIDQMWPEDGKEILSSRHPLACGLDAIVHPSKGCYIGQEVLTRMRSRGRTGSALVRGPASSFDAAAITTVVDGLALAIVRTGNQ